MIQIDLDKMQRACADFKSYASTLMRYMQELEETEGLMKRQGDLQDFTPALDMVREKLQMQADCMKSMAQTAEEIVYCFGFLF